ncbi:BlaB/IND/MUS family subclass B1 metallo-beta-lactamase [Pedobacter sandarakinus]|uniref:BlaB/IND/MUS family subclass B1 metallo-beta-lactamase n=1 Tax=Pedobacter sandarakinus TaxID=353156 RepID=UPI002246C867|nr:BlaB/IND/MUS family subclass B1 metallo-beta-lactamase [Pedobacter sandarakinus]MCX2573343.1 BlaB/IND/MUS family subclass B1 metallo-beta-lactamase [Pedobacter sandarakinus]
MRHIFIVCIILSGFLASAQTPRIKIKPITENLYVFTTYSTYDGNVTDANGMYLVTQKGIVVIDAPWEKEDLQPFMDSLSAKHQEKIMLNIATHAHEDRAGGIAFFKANGIKTYTSKKTDAILKANHKPRAQFTFSNDTTFSIGGRKISTYYAGSGHTSDNIVIWFEKQKVLFGGCLIKSVQASDLGNIAEANLAEWPKTLKQLDIKYPVIKALVTGHQAWGGKESLYHTLTLLENKD